MPRTHFYWLQLWDIYIFQSFHSNFLLLIFILHLQGYRDKLLSEEMQSMVPAGLQGNADILFGNLQEIYTFHSGVFLTDLEESISVTELVALCFVQRVGIKFAYSHFSTLLFFISISSNFTARCIFPLIFFLLPKYSTF